MDKGKRRLIFIILSIVVLSSIFLIIYLNSNSFNNKIKYCETKEDCKIVDCRCSCSGGSGFSYDDAVNKNYENLWYLLRLNCQKPASVRACNAVLCPYSELVCEDNLCVVKTE